MGDHHNPSFSPATRFTSIYVRLKSTWKEKPSCLSALSGFRFQRQFWLWTYEFLLFKYSILVAHLHVYISKRKTSGRKNTCSLNFHILFCFNMCTKYFLCAFTYVIKFLEIITFLKLWNNYYLKGFLWWAGQNIPSMKWRAWVLESDCLGPECLSHNMLCDLWQIIKTILCLGCFTCQMKYLL